MLNIEKVDQSTWVALRTGRTDLAPGDIYESPWGDRYRVLQYPHGASKEFAPGITLDMSPPFDPEVYIPEDGEVAAQPMWVEED